MQHWYVYYKAQRAERAHLIERVREMQRQLEQGNQVKVRLLEREEADQTTLMEVYEDIDEPVRFAAALDAALRASGLAADHVGRRRVERFEDV
jgi:hypothetical protein